MSIYTRSKELPIEGQINVILKELEALHGTAVPAMLVSEIIHLSRANEQLRARVDELQSYVEDGGHVEEFENEMDVEWEHV